jgi:hypothetical protein
MQITFRSPLGQIIENPNMAILHDLVVNLPVGYWDQGSGAATLDCHVEGSRTSLLVFPDSKYGVYLRFYDERKDPWLSLQDETKLLEVVEANDEWYVSRGLFLPIDSAWLAVRDFCLNGKRSLSVRWMPASELPEGGNW